MLRGISVVMSLGVLACGSVKPIAPGDGPAGGDAGMQDGPGSGSGSNPLPTTAIAVTGITAFTAASAAFVTVPYATITYDDAGEFDVASSSFKPKRAGDYLVCAGLAEGSGTPATLQFELDVFVNGTRVQGFASPRTGGIVATVGFVSTGCRNVRLAAGDVLDVRTMQSSGNSVNFATNAAFDSLTIEAQPSTVLVKSTAAIATANATFATIPYTSIIYDDASQFQIATNEFVAAHAGDFAFCAGKGVGTGVVAAIDLAINGTREDEIGLGENAVAGCRSLRLAAADKVSVQVAQNSGASKSLAADAGWDWLSVQPQAISVSETGIAGFSAAGPPTVVPYLNELFDDHDEYDVNTSTFTAAAAGDYEVCASLAYDGDFAAYELDIYKNGTFDVGLSVGSTDLFGGTASCRIVRLAAGDRLQIETQGPSETLTNDAIRDWLEISKLH
jgi:hypothetical protein